MSTLKQYTKTNVYDAAQERIAFAFDNCTKLYVSFSGGKDSSVMLHMVGREARRRGRRIGILIIDLEAQYKSTIEHVQTMVDEYSDVAEVFWVCLPIKLRNAVSNFEPTWCCWQPEEEKRWVRTPPECAITDVNYFDFFEPHMEFEEFMVLFGAWYAGNGGAGEERTAAFVGIRADESLNRFRTIASRSKEMLDGKRYTTKVINELYNVYPIYDWRTEDIWRFHATHPDLDHNKVYDLMHKAGMSIHQMRLCQPYGDDQKRGLWLYQILEPETWGAVVARVGGAGSGARYINESGNVTGYLKISKPEGHTWKSFCNMLLATMPKQTRDHYIPKFRDWMRRWQQRGYWHGIPDEAPKDLERKYWAPSWRRLCKVLLRNDWWCKGLGLTQPKSEAYGRYLEMKKAKKQKADEQEASE